MKKLLIIASVFILALLVAPNVGYAQMIKGTQTKVEGSDPSLQSDSVTITETVTIKSVSGDNDGFWIEKDGKFFKQYKRRNDVSAIDKKLRPGVYTIYPNVARRKTKADVTLTYK